MKNVIAIAAVAGLAATAAAQSVEISFSADQTQINVGDTVHWTVTAEFTGLTATGYFGGFVGEFIASDNSLGTASNFVNNMAGEGTAPVANGATVSAVNVFNSALLGTDNPANPFDFFEFDVTASALGSLSYDAVGVATLFDSDFIFEPPIEFTNFPVVTDTVNIVPAPGAVALLGLSGLVATRRRR